MKLLVSTVSAALLALPVFSKTLPITLDIVNAQGAPDGFSRNPEDPLKHLYDVDDENTIWQVGDWWHNTTLPLLAGYVATGIVPVSDSGTFNGVGRYNGGPDVPFHVVNVVQGTRYRFRIINTSARNVFTISIDSHNMTIIETDGTPTQPMTVNSIDMLAGQRHSIVVEANQPVANYWINAPYVGGDPTRNLNQNATLSRAILRYKGAPAEDPSAPMSLGPAGAALNALVEANLRTAGKAQWNVNNVSYLAPEVPTLVKILEGANSADDFNVTENTFVLPANKIVQVIFPPSIDDEAHRPWFFHCHIFWHFQAGLATVMASGLEETRKEVNPTKAWDALCPAYDALPADLQ
ncbi:hypothetical protein HHX47_DHR1001852 [Lentinula edodes]|nr:hypothetical protein HHX47_DHR1001852 [Lentinula edodes]